MDENTNNDLSRRNFLFKGGKSLALLASANVGVYVIGSAFKDLDGGLVAGAKTCGYDQGFGSTGCDHFWVDTGPTCVGGPAPAPPCDALSTPCSCF